MSGTAYEYRAIDRAGERRVGVVSAAAKDEAFRKVAALGLTPLKLREARTESGRRVLGRRVTPKDIAQFTHQLAVLLEARIPIAEGVRGVAEQEPNERFRRALLDIAGAIQAGSSVTAAVAEHRGMFGDVFVETIRAAEKSGNMIRSLEHLADMLERQEESRQHLKQAMTYPIVVVVALGSATLFMIAIVVPRFALMFSDRGVELPALTRGLQAFGVSLRSFWWAYGAGIVGGSLGVRRLWGTAHGRRVIDRLLHRVPYLRRVLVGLAVGRFARILGISLGSGLGLIESLEMSGRATGRPLLIEDAQRMIEQVRLGGRLSDVLRTTGFLPGFARRMLAAGEASAELPRMCDVVARHYERETASLIKSAATVIEPLLIALLTGVVLVVALAIFMPMWDMVGLVG